MHLSTEQHGAYLLLLFHLWRRGMLPDDDVTPGADYRTRQELLEQNSRAVLAEFFEIRDGQWHHGRVERERTRVNARQQVYSNRAKAELPAGGQMERMLQALLHNAMLRGDA